MADFASNIRDETPDDQNAAPDSSTPKRKPGRPWGGKKCGEADGAYQGRYDAEHNRPMSAANSRPDAPEKITSGPQPRPKNPDAKWRADYGAAYTEAYNAACNATLNGPPELPPEMVTDEAASDSPPASVAEPPASPAETATPPVDESAPDSAPASDAEPPAPLDPSTATVGEPAPDSPPTPLPDFGADFGRSKNESRRDRLFESLIPAPLKVGILALQEDDERSHRALRERLDRFYPLVMTYKDNRNVTDYLRQTKRVGRKPRGVFQPWVKWAFPKSRGSWTLWAQVCEAAAYFERQPSAAIDESTLGNGNLRRLVKTYKERAGLVRKRSTPQDDIERVELNESQDQRPEPQPDQEPSSFAIGEPLRQLLALDEATIDEVRKSKSMAFVSPCIRRCLPGTVIVTIGVKDGSSLHIKREDLFPAFDLAQVEAWEAQQPAKQEVEERKQRRSKRITQ